MDTPWSKYLTDSDHQTWDCSRTGQKKGYGQRPALIVIDAQKIHSAAGPCGGQAPAQAGQPSAYGRTVEQARAHIQALVALAQRKSIPCFFTLCEMAQCRTLQGAGSAHAGHAATGVQLGDSLQPGIYDTVYTKQHASAFHGTALLAYLIDRGIDTLIIVGGATSDCVRATVFDAASYNYRAIVPMEAVFDRFEVSHAISLFDMNRQFADVRTTIEVLDYLQSF